MSNELDGNKRPAHKAGVYEHKESGTRIYLETNPELGTAMIDGFVKMGYVWIADKEADVASTTTKVSK